MKRQQRHTCEMKEKHVKEILQNEKQINGWDAIGWDVMTIRSFKSEGKEVPSSDCTVLCTVCVHCEGYVRDVSTS